MERLPVGSKEYLVVDVTDRVDGITTLDGAILSFDVKDDEGGFRLQNQVATNDGMKVKCLVDTTGWVPEEYALYLDIVAIPEEPRLGPFRFKVD